MKRKTIKKIASLLALTITATSVLVGCGKKDDKPASVPDGGQVSGTESKQESESSEEVKVEKKGSIKVMIYDRASIPNSEGDMTNNRWTDWIRENAPVENIEFVPIPKAEGYETMNLQFLSGTGPDFYPNTESRLTEFVTQGMAAEITDEMLDKMPNYKKILEDYPIMVKGNTKNGKLYGLGMYKNWCYNHTMIVREDWMENLGLEAPETAEDLYDILYAFTYNDPDGNGVNDTWGINLTADGQRVLSHMFGFGNPEKYKFDENGNFVYAWENIEAWLTFCKRIVADKLVNPDYATMKGDDDQADFFSGKIGIWCSGRMGDYNSRWNTLKESLPDAKFTSFALPDGGFGKYTAYGAGIETRGFISSDAKDLDATLAYVNWLYDPAVADYLYYGEEGVYNARNEYGTWATVDVERSKIESDYKLQDYCLITSIFMPDSAIAAGYSPRANDDYNKSLSTDDTIRQEHGIFNYKLYTITSDPNVTDPRVYLTQGKPNVPEEMAVSFTTADSMINDILKAGISEANKTAAEVVAEAKSVWEAAGGAEIDAWYADFYMNDPNALLPSDFLSLKIVPEMTPIARENALALGFNPDEWTID